MSKYIIRFLAVVAGLFLAEHFIPGVSLDGLYTATIVAILLGVVNIIIRPILVVLTLPITILTLGLFLFVVNGLLFWFVGSFVEGFDVAGFVPALLGSLTVSLTSWVANKLT